MSSPEADADPGQPEVSDLTPAKTSFARPAPRLLQALPWVFMVGVMALLGGFGSWLEATDQGGLWAFSQRLAAGVIPPWGLATTLLSLGLATCALVFLAYPAWLRRRYGRCEVTRDTLVLTSPALYLRPLSSSNLEVVSRQGATWRVTPHGVLVEPSDRTAWERWTRPLLIPASPGAGDELARWLEGKPDTY